MEADLGLFVGQLFPQKSKPQPHLNRFPLLSPIGKPSDWPAWVGVLLEEEPSLEGLLVRVASGLRQPQSFPVLGAQIPALCRVFSRKQALTWVSAVLGSAGHMCPWSQSPERASLLPAPLSTPLASEGASARIRSLPACPRTPAGNRKKR